MLIVIEGVVMPDRRKFRPSDWAGMLIEGVGLAHFGPNHKIHYEDDVEPATIEGCASIIFDEAIEQSHPVAYAELLHFATKNNLNIFMQEGTIPHDGLAAESAFGASAADGRLGVPTARAAWREQHANHDPHIPLVGELIV